jgi:hypothetical protein
LKLPELCVDALRGLRQRQLAQRFGWGSAFAARHGAQLDAANVRRPFRERAEREGRLEVLPVEVLTAIGERDGTVLGRGS